MSTDAEHYFQSSLLAEEMEEIWLGSIRFNSEQALTEAEKARARENIGAISFGGSLKIKGHFDTLAELQSNVPNPNIGDAYSIGTEVPYNLFVYDGLRLAWLDYGAIRATDISARSVSDITVPVSAWEEDTTVFTDYTFKARISITDVTVNDFPIVVFDPRDAVSGNFCPISYTFNGAVEIWAKAIPSDAINIPAITFITEGNA